MAKILLLPLLQIPSGHHQVADAVSRWLTQHNSKINAEKVELLSHFNPLIEKMVSQTYLKWIHHFPRLYGWTYRQLAYNPNEMEGRKYWGYELLFINELKEIITQTDPDLIICTHSFPSYLCSRLKQLGEIKIPVINIYTDYFINQQWGIEGVDLHFVPAIEFKEKLLGFGVDLERIFVTGIPIDQAFFYSTKSDESERGSQNILIGGGSIGVSIASQFFQQSNDHHRLHYTILCGKNERLYQEIERLKLPHITPLSYISSREEMNRLYERMDAIVTKPGGVTISECLHKRLPIFIHSALPGQEEMNRSFLLSKELAYAIEPAESLEMQLLNRLSDQNKRETIDSKIGEYLSSLEWENALRSLISIILQ